jgi:triphosphatase
MTKRITAPPQSAEPAAFIHLVSALADHGLDMPGNRKEKSNRAPVSQIDVALSRRFTVRDAFGAIALACLRHWALNRDAVIAGDAEGVHQMRVGLRRFRAALSLFKKHVSDPETAELKRELEWLTDQLGPARDADVFLEETLKPRRPVHARLQGFPVLEGHLEEVRGREIEKARNAVESTRFRKLVIRTFVWILAGRWTRRKAASLERPSRAFARRTLTKRTKKIVRRLRDVERLDDQRRHKLRIAVKKLRYATEFFEEIFPAGKPRRTFARILKELQDSLGHWNDIRTHKRYSGALIRERVRRPTASSEAFALGYVTGEEQSDVDALLRGARKMGKRLARAEQYWC